VLNKELNAGVADAKVKARIAGLGGIVLGGSAAEFGTLLSEATEKWAKVIKFAGIRAEWCSPRLTLSASGYSAASSKISGLECVRSATIAMT
jgi:hypothetical protein